MTDPTWFELNAHPTAAMLSEWLVDMFEYDCLRMLVRQDSGHDAQPPAEAAEPDEEEFRVGLKRRWRWPSDHTDSNDWKSLSVSISTRAVSKEQRSTGLGDTTRFPLGVGTWTLRFACTILTKCTPQQLEQSCSLAFEGQGSAGYFRLRISVQLMAELWHAMWTLAYPGEKDAAAAAGHTSCVAMLMLARCSLREGQVVATTMFLADLHKWRSLAAQHYSELDAANNALMHRAQAITVECLHRLHEECTADEETSLSIVQCVAMVLSPPSSVQCVQSIADVRAFLVLPELTRDLILQSDVDQLDGRRVDELSMISRTVDRAAPGFAAGSALFEWVLCVLAYAQVSLRILGGVEPARTLVKHLLDGASLRRFQMSDAAAAVAEPELRKRCTPQLWHLDERPFNLVRTLPQWQHHTANSTAPLGRASSKHGHAPRQGRPMKPVSVSTAHATQQRSKAVKTALNSPAASSAPAPVTMAYATVSPKPISQLRNELFSLETRFASFETYSKQGGDLSDAVVCTDVEGRAISPQTDSAAALAATITPEDLQRLTSLRFWPHPAIVVCMSAVLVCVASSGCVPDTSWRAALRCLDEPAELIDGLRNVAKRGLSAHAIDRLSVYLSCPTFTHSALGMLRVDSDSARVLSCLCSFVRAVCHRNYPPPVGLAK